MQETETIKVYIDTKDGKTSCICLRSKKRCGKNCAKDEVSRDKYRGWMDTMKRDRFGR